MRRSHKLMVKFPAGIDDGQTLRVRGEGNTGLNGGPNGDLMVTVSVRSHPLFTRQGQDVYCEMPITFTQAACGAEVEVPTLDGKVRYTIGEGTQTRHDVPSEGQGHPLCQRAQPRRPICHRRRGDADPPDARAEGSAAQVRGGDFRKRTAKTKEVF